MKKFKHIKIILSIAIIGILGLCKFTGVLPYVVARISSSIYVSIHYPTKGLKFHNAGWF